ncbi:MAG: aminoglycoside phosphotransferase family protein [Nitriliruptoraceae bacterium]
MSDRPTVRTDDQGSSVAAEDTTDPLLSLTAAEERAVLAEATRAAGAQLSDSTVRSIHHRPGRSRSVLHDATIDTPDGTRTVLLVTHTDTRGFPEGAFVLAQGGRRVAVWRFPHDPYLPGLPSALSAARVRELLDELGGVPGEVRLRTPVYRPTRRAVVEARVDGLDAAGRILYLKVLPSGRAGSVARRHRQLVAVGLPVPVLIGVAEQQGIVALEALAGATLGDALRAGARVPAVGELVSMSQRFATSGVAGSRDPRSFADPVRHVSLLAGVLPERRAEITALARAASEVTGPIVGVHGDLHPGQLLIDAEGRLSGVIDVDGAGRGLLAHDAGNLVAHLEALADLQPMVAERVRAYAAEVSAAYREVVGDEPLARAAAGSWIGLATGSYRRQGAGWREETARRLDRAAALLADV